MPYRNLRELPKGVRGNLPKHAQEIYRETYNSAWKMYRDPERRRQGATREEVSHRVAWTAVKREYKKDPQTGKWKRKL
jgi:cation transport regulator